MCYRCVDLKLKSCWIEFKPVLGQNRDARKSILSLFRNPQTNSQFYPPKGVVFTLLENSGCGLHLGASQNRGSRCTLPQYDDHFDMRMMEIGGEVESGQRSNGRGCFLSVFKTLPFNKNRC